MVQQGFRDATELLANKLARQRESALQQQPEATADQMEALQRLYQPPQLSCQFSLHGPNVAGNVYGGCLGQVAGLPGISQFLDTVDNTIQHCHMVSIQQEALMLAPSGGAAGGQVVAGRLGPAVQRGAELVMQPFKPHQQQQRTQPRTYIQTIAAAGGGGMERMSLQKVGWPFFRWLLRVHFIAILALVGKRHAGKVLTAADYAKVKDMFPLGAFAPGVRPPRVNGQAAAAAAAAATTTAAGAPAAEAATTTRSQPASQATSALADWGEFGADVDCWLKDAFKLLVPQSQHVPYVSVGP